MRLHGWTFPLVYGRRCPAALRGPIMAANCPATTGCAGRFGRWWESPWGCVCPGQGPGLASTNRQPLLQPGHNWPGPGTPIMLPLGLAQQPSAASPFSLHAGLKTSTFPRWVTLNPGLAPHELPMEARSPLQMASMSIQDVCRWEVGADLRPWPAPLLYE